MLSLLVLISLAGQAPKVEGAKKVEKSIPDDFKIVARAWGEFTGWAAWKSTITADGKVLQHTNDHGKPSDRESKLSPADLRDLMDQIENADFSRLKEKYDYSISDGYTLVLEITANQKTHKVSIYEFDKVKEKDDVDRFLKVFREVLKKVPSPNEEETPDVYQR